MRRSDREVRDIQGIVEILELCKTCHVAMLDGDAPYVLPLSFGYTLEDGALTLFFHGAKEGHKIDLLRKNSTASFSMCFEGEPIFANETPCDSGYYYASVMGVGKAEFVEDPAEKCRALSHIMRRQAGLNIPFTPEQANTVCVFKLVADSFTGKRKQHPATAPTH